MSEVKFTPGPWIVDKEKTSIVRMNSYFRIEQTAVSEDLPENFSTTDLINEGDANAKLIAAAPDMYEAIRSALNIKDLWSAQQHGTVSADHEGEMLALRAMEIMLQAALDKATV